MIRKEPTVTKLAAILVLLVALALAGCGKKEEHKKQVGPIKDWIVGSWAREDDPNWWTFTAEGEFSTTGRVPITGSYGTEEPNIVKITISGAGASTASYMLGVPLSGENKNLYLDLVVTDDEMRPSSIVSKTRWRKK
jgi:hypothetical protein